MNIKVSGDHHYSKFTLSGALYVNESAILREKIIEQINEGKRNFLLDLSEVSYIDSSGLGVLISMQKRIKERDGRLKITGLTGEVKKLFEITRLTKVFEIGE